jgi:hypothetical protein
VEGIGRPGGQDQAGLNQAQASGGYNRSPSQGALDEESALLLRFHGFMLLG